MIFNPDIHQRHSLRLKDYDYGAAGAYFVTICTFQRECLFGEITVGAGSKLALGSKPAQSSNPAPGSNSTDQTEPVMLKNEFGMLVEHTWHDLPAHNRYVLLDAFVIMPNHFHGIIIIDNGQAGLEGRAGLERRAGLEPAPTLSELVRQFKTFSSRRINKLRNNPGCPIWQRSFYERVIRNDKEMAAMREYIVNNPMKWALDKENPANCLIPQRIAVKSV